MFPNEAGSGHVWRCNPIATEDLSTGGYTSFMPRFTQKQGQYLAFIYYYTKINRQPPPEADFQKYFRVSPPSVHQMIVTLETGGLIGKIPGQGRSIRLLVSREEIPDLK